MPPRPPPSSTTGPASSRPFVLVVAEDPGLRRPLVSTLVASGFASLETGPEPKSLARAVTQAHELVLLDLDPPERAGGASAARLAARVRAVTSAPILVILPRPDEPAQTAVLDAGANDFIVRPFNTPDLLARVRVWLRHVSRLESTRGALRSARERVRFDGETRTLFVDGRAVHITPIERKLVLALVRSAGEAMTENQAIAAVWGKRTPPQARYLRSLVRQLRLKIERDPSRPEHLTSTLEGGYRLNLGKEP